LFWSLNCLLNDFNILVLKFSSLLESAESLSLLAELVLGRLVVDDGTDIVLGTCDVGVADEIGFMGGLISLIHTEPETK
jgi:hypothetical protein